MPETRFQAIIQNLHFANNEVQDTNDKVAKIRLLLDHFNRIFSERLKNSENQSIAKHMCKFKGKSKLKQSQSNGDLNLVLV